MKTQQQIIEIIDKKIKSHEKIMKLEEMKNDVTIQILCQSKIDLLNDIKKEIENGK